MLDYMAARFHGIKNPELAYEMCIFLFHLHMCRWAMALRMRFPHLHRISNQHSWELIYVREHDAALNTEAHPNKLAVFVIGWVFNVNMAVIGANLEVWTNRAFDMDTHSQIRRAFNFCHPKNGHDAIGFQWGHDYISDGRS